MDNETTILAGLSTIIRKVDSLGNEYITKHKAETKELYTERDYTQSLIVVYYPTRKRILSFYYRDYISNCIYTGLRLNNDGVHTLYDASVDSFSETKFAIDTLIDYCNKNCKSNSIIQALTDVKNGIAYFDSIGGLISSYHSDDIIHDLERRKLEDYLKYDYVNDYIEGEDNDKIKKVILKDYIK